MSSTHFWPRTAAAQAANTEDADIWRWFAILVDERRIRWCCAHGKWLVSVDHRHVSTETTFDDAVRSAKLAVPDVYPAGRTSRKYRNGLA